MLNACPATTSHEGKYQSLALASAALSSNGIEAEDQLMLLLCAKLLAHLPADSLAKPVLSRI